MYKQHAAIRRHLIAKHQAALALGIVVGDFHDVALATDLDPRSAGRATA